MLPTKPSSLRCRKHRACNSVRRCLEILECSNVRASGYRIERPFVCKSPRRRRAETDSRRLTTEIPETPDSTLQSTGCSKSERTSATRLVGIDSLNIDPERAVRARLGIPTFPELLQYSSKNNGF